MELYTSGYVCDQLGIKYHVLDYLVRNQHIPYPVRTDSGQRVFTPEDIQSIKKVLKKRQAKNASINKKKAVLLITK